MPLIINELITHIETPQDSLTQLLMPTGVDKAEQRVYETLAVSQEREERLKID